MHLKLVHMSLNPNDRFFGSLGWNYIGANANVAPEWVATQFPGEIAFRSNINAALKRCELA